VLKKDAAKLFEIEQDFVSQGLLEPLDVEGKKVKVVPKAICNTVDDVSAPTVEDPLAEIDDNQPFNRNISTYGDLAFSTLSRAFQTAEPTIFTPANIKAMQLRGQRQVSITRMTDTLEYLSDINKDEVMDKSIRTKRAIIDHMVAEIHAKGRRGQDLVMPPDYKKQGPYEIKQKDTEVTVRLRWTDQTTVIAVPRNSKAYLDIAHSTLRCKFRIDGGNYAKVLWQVFIKLKAEKQASKKRMPEVQASEPATRRRIPAKMLDSSPQPTKQLAITNLATNLSDDEGKAIEDGFAEEEKPVMVKRNSGKGSGIKTIDNTINFIDMKIRGQTNKHHNAKASSPVKVLSEPKFRTHIFSKSN
jgi:hypothetical protein